jgi:hypothetical protein
MATITEYPFECISLFLERVGINVSIDQIASVFKPFGEIRSVDFKVKKDQYGTEFKIAFVHFSMWRDEPANRKFQKELFEGKKMRVYYDTRYWNVLPCLSKVKDPVEEENAKLVAENAKLQTDNIDLNLRLIDEETYTVKLTEQLQEADIREIMLQDEIAMLKLRILAYEEDEKMRHKIQNHVFGTIKMDNEFEDGECSSDVDEQEVRDAIEDELYADLYDYEEANEDEETA